MAEHVTELTVEQVRRVCDPGSFHFSSTAEVPSLEEVIGQDRALRAISFGIDIMNDGYHMYALGPSGTGKTTTILKYLEREASHRPVPDDWLYVHNFSSPDNPCTLRLPAGVGCKFRADMDRLADELRGEVERAFESMEYAKQQEQLSEELQKQGQARLQQVDDYARTKGLTLIQTPQGFALVPEKNGNVLSPEQIRHMDDATRKQMEVAQEDVQQKLRDAMREIQQQNREIRERAADLDRQAVAFATGHLIDEIKAKYAEFDTISKLLEEIRKDILDNVEAIKQVKQLEQMQAEQGPMAMMLGKPQLSFDQYRVNLIVDNCDTKGAPVILVRNPTYNNLTGRIEHQGQFGTLVTNFRMIKAGLLHKANGGYLMLDVREVLTKPLAWEGLIRALKNKVVEIESMADAYGLFATRSLEPEPIPLTIKVVLIGDPMIYYLLFAYDPDFRELFKVKVDFSRHMDRTPETTEQYARFIATVCREEGLTPCDPGGVARIVEHGSRLVEHQEKLDTKFGDIVDLIRQADYWARQNGHECITAEDVKKTIDEKVYRANQIEQLLQEMIAEGTLLISTDGEVTGQINGLAVLGMGDYAFGKPSRITARTHIGDSGVVNIDREVKLGGRIHNKGSLILTGYLGAKYATDVPMALTASITFEQEYEEIEGDSASSAELYALLSSLSGFPIRQDLAVTGSVNQRGEVQAIGGVNQKVEGYFDVCRIVGLTGQQGVMIPQSNVKHLMLRDDVVEAIRDGKFHIYPIASIDDGIALLTGKQAGELQPDGRYPDGTVNGEVHRHLREMAQKVRAYAHPEEKKQKGDEEEWGQAA